MFYLAYHASQYSQLTGTPWEPFDPFSWTFSTHEEAFLPRGIRRTAGAAEQAREARAKFYEKRAERTELARRIREEDARKKEEWEAEVAQFGKEEAKRRRCLVREIR